MTGTDELIRKAVEVFGPEFTYTLVKAHSRSRNGVSILNDIASGDIEVRNVTKAKRHDVRGPDHRFQPAVITTQHEFGPIRHSGNVHPIFRATYAQARGRHETSVEIRAKKPSQD